MSGRCDAVDARLHCRSLRRPKWCAPTFPLTDHSQLDSSQPASLTHNTVSCCSDPRDTDSTGPSSRARSINLAVSNRGIHALQKISGRLAEQVLVNLVPMHGRMIHTVAGDTQSQKYGLHGEVRHLRIRSCSLLIHTSLTPNSFQAIYSIDRQMLNNTLLTQVSQMDRVTTHFNMKLSKAQFDQGLLTFANGQEVKTDLVVGTDGAYSKVRQEMMRVTRCAVHLGSG